MTGSGATCEVPVSVTKNVAGAGLPAAVYVLGLGIFAQGTSELMLAGLLPDLARDLGVDLPTAGLLISGFALGMLLGAPILGLTTHRWRRRRALLGFLAAFVLAHVIGALAGSYLVLLLSRFVAAFVYAGFWAVAAGTAVGLAPAGKSARAMSIIAGGLTIAVVAGLPAGTYLGQQVGWRGVFWVIVGLSVLAMVAIAALVPDAAAQGPRSTPLSELRALSLPRLWLSYAMAATSTAAVFATFGYLAALVEHATTLPPTATPLLLLVYGGGAVVGISLGGRWGDAHPFATLLVGFSAVAFTSLALSVGLHHSELLAVLLGLLGVAGFTINPVLNSRAFWLAPGAPTMAPAFTVAAINAGIALGPWLAGRALSVGLDYGSLPLIGAAFALSALGMLIVDRRLGHPEPPPPAEN